MVWTLGKPAQDYNYIWAQCMEITVELSCCKYPPVNELQQHWLDNKKPLVQYLMQVHIGIKGRVFDTNGNPIKGASVRIKGRDNILPYNATAEGEYYRLLLTGQYTILGISHSFAWKSHKYITSVCLQRSRRRSDRPAQFPTSILKTG
ncbi:carboxypeptidase M-like [Carcharodon carcharias]|uniref:carboxypeptidase M-like n=1 Tax=Carcharodon carcharias TaxID=13397 RepID=UPI001B7E42DA|nr:carboxypeptidase M-like [Carcharodon carcharias]